TPGVGFGSGLERLLLALEAQKVELPRPRQRLVWLISQNEPARQHNLALLRELRQAGIPADMDLTGRAMKSQFKLAEREGATVALIVGESELSGGTVMLKDMATQQQTPVARAEVIRHLSQTQG